MIFATLLATVFIQAPEPTPAWLASGGDPHRPDAIAVSGTVELTRGEARQAAMQAAADELGYRLGRRGEELLAARRPVWLPGFVGRQILDRWSRGLRLADALTVVEERIDERDHGFGPSYQAHLLVASDEAFVSRSMDRLRARVSRGAELFLYTAGGTVAFWGLLALLYMWLDRLTRGYMSWRLRALFGGMGATLPVIAFLII